MPAIPQEMLERCRAIRKAYRELEIKHHEKSGPLRSETVWG